MSGRQADLFDGEEFVVVKEVTMNQGNASLGCDVNIVAGIGRRGFVNAYLR